MIHALDQTGDTNGQQLYRLSRLYNLPPFVKKASSTDIIGDDGLENHQYADPTHRSFPCHSAPATYISTLFFMDKKAEIDPGQAEFIEARLDDFAFVHGIVDTVRELKTKLAADKPTDNIDKLADDTFALVLEPAQAASGIKERHYPMRNALEVKRAAEYLKEYEGMLPFRMRQQMATKIIKRANQYGAGLGDLDDFLQKQAGFGAAAAVDVCQFLFDRARLLKKAGKLDYVVQLGKVAQAVAGDPDTIRDNGRLVKLAIMVDDVDRETGLDKSVALPRPEDAFFKITEKMASALRTEHFASTNGNIYKVADMDNLKLSDVRDLMGSDFADAISIGGLFISADKVASIVPTLPKGDAELFDRALISANIRPVAKEAAHHDDRCSHEELSALATLHRR